MSENLKVLVTGATGFVGRNVVTQLLERGVRVRALTRNPDSAQLPAEVEVVRGDLTDPATLAPVFEGIDAMYLFPVNETAREVIGMATRAGVRASSTCPRRRSPPACT